jgi:multidrug resistance efflux pump
LNVDPLTPIPASARLIWGQFRLRVMPMIMFLALVGLSVVLWSRLNSVPSLAGVAEGVRSPVMSPHTGRIVELKVRPYQIVTQGEPIAVVQPADPRMPLELLQAELQLAKMRHEPTMAEQNAMDYQRVRVEFLRLKSELAVARVNLRSAETELNRNRPLYQAKLVSDSVYDLSLQTRDALKAEVTAKEQSVADLEQCLEDLRTLGDPTLLKGGEPLQQLLTRLEAVQAQAASNWGPMTLVAPVSGMVCPGGRQEGEIVLEGEPVIGIETLRSDRVLAYLRQPYPVDPEVGMRVRMTTRNRVRQQFSLCISHIGAQVQPITNALAFVRQGALVDVGLPIVIDLSAGCGIRPGELVDLRIEATRMPGT